jgi:pseudouridine-5'-phosphate glycosidase/pseudouridine kinase
MADVTSFKPGELVKVSRRDLGPMMALKRTGGTTIAGTSVLAHLAGIKVFATGGLGGVHRGGENSMDISADLTEMGRTPIAVVCSGPKSILDVGRTLEYLETQGVTVVSYSDTQDFPAFYMAKSGFKVPWNVNDPRAAAQILYYGHQLSLESGTVFGVPVPAEHASAAEEIQRAVDQAVLESEQNGMARGGSDVTPWLLERVHELTNGGSLMSNIAFIENATVVGTKIAVEYSKLLQEEHSSPV